VVVKSKESVYNIRMSMALKNEKPVMTRAEAEKIMRAEIKKGEASGISPLDQTQVWAQIRKV
jgi:hypothetical protein